MAQDERSDGLASRKAELECAKLLAEEAKLRAEILKIEQERRLYPYVVGTGLMLAIVGVARLFL